MAVELTEQVMFIKQTLHEISDDNAGDSEDDNSTERKGLYNCNLLNIYVQRIKENSMRDVSS